MAIPWIYLNKRAATISALKDFNSMQRIIDTYQDDAEEVQAFLTGTNAATPVRLKKNTNPKATESKIAATLDLAEVIENRYQQAVEYMLWFRPAWEGLSVENRYLLTEFFLREDSSQTDTLQRVTDHLGFERTAIYNRRDQAISKLSRLLYGK